MINHLILQKNWQTQLSEAISSIDELLAILKLESLRSQIYVPTHFEQQLNLQKKLHEKSQGK